MLICKKEFISAVASTISFSRIQRTQPAAAFLSPLSFLKPFLSSMRKRFLRAMATTKKQATVPQTMPLPFGQLGVTELAGRRPRTPRFLTRGQHVLAPVFYVFPPFMPLHLRAGAVACIASGIFHAPEVFLVS